MKNFLIVITILNFSSVEGQTDKDFLQFYSRDKGKADSSYYCSIIKKDKGYSFVFPEIISKYYQLKDSITMAFDTITEKRRSIFGPYYFFKRKNKILFKNLIISKKYFDLYNIDTDEFLAPDLFSSSSNSYNILTKMLDSNVVLQGVSRSVNCFRYLQFMEYHNSREYRIIYIDKKSLLPYKFEYYTDKDLKSMSREIFAVIN